MFPGIRFYVQLSLFPEKLCKNIVTDRRYKGRTETKTRILMFYFPDLLLQKSNQVTSKTVNQVLESDANVVDPFRQFYSIETGY